MYEIYLKNVLIDFYLEEEKAIARVENLLKCYKGQIQVRKGAKAIYF